MDPAVVASVAAAVVAALLLIPGLRITTLTFIRAFGGFVDALFSWSVYVPSEAVLTALKKKRALITGGNRGLGRGIAIQLAASGVHVTVACRSGLEDAADDITAEAVKLARRMGTGVAAPRVDCVPLDLNALSSVEACAKELRERRAVFDIMISNAAVVPLRNETNGDGFEQSFAVNYLGHFHLFRLLMDNGVLPYNVGKMAHRRRSTDTDVDNLPRIIMISSEVHRQGAPLSSVRLGEIVPYNAIRALSNYSYTKLLVCTFGSELARRLNRDDLQAVVFTMCPGPVNTDIVRNAGAVLQALTRLMFVLCFKSPIKAANPVLRLATQSLSELDPDGDHGACSYFHMQKKKPARDDVNDAAVSGKLWDDTEELLAPFNKRRASS